MDEENVYEDFIKAKSWPQEDWTIQQILDPESGASYKGPSYDDLLKAVISKDEAKALSAKYVSSQPWTDYVSGGYATVEEPNPCEEVGITPAPHHSDKGYNPDTGACLCSKCSFIEQHPLVEKKKALAAEVEEAAAEAKSLKAFLKKSKVQADLDPGGVVALTEKETKKVQAAFAAHAAKIFPKTTIQSSSLAYVPDNTVYTTKDAWGTHFEYEVISGTGQVISKSDQIFPVTFQNPVEVGAPAVVQLPDGTEVYIPTGSAIRPAVEGDDPDVDD